MLNSPNLPDGRGRVSYSPFTAFPTASPVQTPPLAQAAGGSHWAGGAGEDRFRSRALSFQRGGESFPKEVRFPPQGLDAQPPNARQTRIAEKPTDSAGNATHPPAEPKVNGSKLIGAFKITSALVVTGAVNAFFFGVPIYISSGIAAAVAGAQALAALKIHKEDTPFTQKLMAFTRKLMGREKDLTPAGKEWSMVPVWAGICGAFGLSEAFLNHVFKESTGYQKKTFEDRKKSILNEIQRSRFGLKRAVLGQQLRGMSLVESCRRGLVGKFDQWAKQEGASGMLLNRLTRFLKRFNSGGAARPNYPLIYLWSLGMASFAGAAQTVLAALMQQKIDRANGIVKAK